MNDMKNKMNTFIRNQLRKASAGVTPPVWSEEQLKQEACFADPDNPDSLLITCEVFGSGFIIDYYGEYRGGYPWVDPELEKMLVDAGWGYEWEHPGAIVIFKD